MKITLKKSARLFAIIMTAFFLISLLVPAVTFAQSEQIKLEGWRIAATDWTPSNLNPQGGYAELDWVPFRLNISNFARDPEQNATASFSIKHDYYSPKNDVYGYVDARNFRVVDVTTGLPTDANIRLVPGNSFTVTGPTYVSKGEEMQYTFEIDTQVLNEINSGNFAIYWEAQLAGPLQASQWPGSSLHTNFVGPPSKTVSINPKNITAAVPAIRIEKGGPEYAIIGETISYSLVVTNYGNQPLTNVVVSDPLIQLENNGMIGNLAVDQSVTISGTYTIPEGNYPNGLLNTAEVTGECNGMTVTDQDTHTVTILRTDISVDKTGPNTAEVGETITYTITVTNTGDVDLYNVLVTDAKLGFSQTIAVLAARADVSFDVDYTVTEGDYPSTQNTANAAGANEFGADPVSDQDNHTISVLRTGIEVTKTAKDTAEVGEEITYTITVENTGDVALTNVNLVDAMLGIDETFDLAVGQTRTFTGTYTVTAEDDLIVNTASATGTNSSGGDEVSDEASHTTNVLRTGITITKTGPEEADVGEVITYTITVTNTGDVDLYNVLVVDAKLGFSETIPVLAAGDFVTFDINYLVTDADYPTLENTAVVTATNEFGADPVEAVDNHDVLVFREEVIPPDDPQVDPDPEPEDPDLPQTGSTRYLMIGFGLLLALAGLSLRKKELTT